MDSIWKTDFAIAHTVCLARSLKHWTGRELLAGVSSPAELAHGISVALYNTAMGLIVAIPSMIFYRFFRGRVDALLVEMEQQAIKLVEIVHGERK